MLHDKKLNYGKFVKDEYLPPRSQKKMQEMNDIKSKLQGYNQRKIPFREDMFADLPYNNRI